MTENIKLGESKPGYEGLVRPHYSAGLLLQDDDLTQGVNYTRELSRLMFRTLFGCGVLCGLKVKDPKSDQCNPFSVSIEKGVALDCVGDPIQVPAVELKVECNNKVGDTVWIGLRKIEKCCAPRVSECSPEDSDPACVCTRERDGFEIQLFSDRPPCTCGCRKLEEQKQQPAPTPTPAEKRRAAAAAAKASNPNTEEKRANDPTCLCNHRNQVGECYEDFYNGKCACDCCECEWILLAVVERKNNEWQVDHSVRRFVRPVLMRDPLAP